MTHVTVSSERVAAPAWRRVAAQAAMELRLLARNGENLLVTLGIPAGLLVFFALVDVLPTGGEHPLVFLLPRMLAVAVMGSALVAVAIHTGFERSYLVLKRLGATPLRRRDLVAAKAVAVAVTVVVQALLLVTLAAALGWQPGLAAMHASVSGGVASAGEPAGGGLAVAGATVLALGLGTCAFAGLGLLLAGTLRATMTLAAANALFVVLLFASGLLFPLDSLPPGGAVAAGVLPSTALAQLLDAALHAGRAPRLALLVLAAWAVVTPALAAWRFRWE